MSQARRKREPVDGRGGQFCPKCAMVRAIDHAISVVRPVERIGFLWGVGACERLDIDYPRSASDDPLETLVPCKNTVPYAKTHMERETSLTVTLRLLPFLFMVEDT